jgi:hypothetical protein
MPTAPRRSPFNRPRWTEEDAREVLAALQRSGKSVGVFAQERGLDPQRVYLWRRRLGSVVEPAQFREVVVRPSRGQPKDDPISWFEIALGCADEKPMRNDHAALEYRWCSPPARGSATTSPALGGWTARATGASRSSDM